MMVAYILRTRHILLCLLLILSKSVQGTNLNDGLPFTFLSFDPKHSGTSWKEVGETFFNPLEASHKILSKGKGVIAYLPKGKLPPDYQRTFQISEAGDLELVVDFMLSPNAGFVLTLGDSFEIALNDSPSDTGLSGVVTTTGFTYPPHSDVTKAPGLWQTIRFVVRNTGSSLILLEKVYLNGVLIHQGIGDPRKVHPEGGTLSLTVRGRDKPFSIRNICYRRYENIVEPDQKRSKAVFGEIVLPVTQNPVLLRSFIMHNSIKKTHVLSTGYKEGINMTYNLAKGAPIGVWRGLFLKTNNMWDQRGLSQIAEPLGNLLFLPDTPSLSLLTGQEMVWPDSSTRYSDYRYRGYALDEAGHPEFLYTIGDVPVTEKFHPQAAGHILERTFIVDSQQVPGLWCRAAVGRVRKVAKGLYSINDYQYLIKTKGEVSIRKMGDQEELLLALKGKGLTYAIIY
jgi:hypothetical protein